MQLAAVVLQWLIITLRQRVWRQLHILILFLLMRLLTILAVEPGRAPPLV